MSRAFVSLSVLPCIAFCSFCRAATIVENFDDGILDPNFDVIPTAGAQAELAGGELVLTHDGSGAGGIYVRSRFCAVGDFTATVDASRVNLPSSAAQGLVTFHEEGFTDVFFNHANHINANIFVPSPPGFGSQIVADSSQDATFRIRRVGNTIYEEVRHRRRLSDPPRGNEPRSCGTGPDRPAAPR